MWYIILSIIILMVIEIFILIKNSDLADWGPLTIINVFLGGIILFVIGCFAIPATTGLLPDYSTGERVGYITKISDMGIIWKTHEGEMQIGVGEMAALQEPFCFSVVDENVWKELQAFQGNKQIFKLEYKQWLIMPFRIGETKYEIINIIRKEQP